MTINVIFSLICLSCALLLISHCKYEEGLVGRASLLMLIVAETVVIAEAWYDQSYELAPTTLLGHGAISLFLARHTYKFMSYQYFGHYAWDRRSEKREVA